MANLTETSTANSCTKVHIIGGGLAGSEAAWQLLRRGIPVALYEMRPERLTPAHKTGQLAELVCSNSLKSLGEDTAPGLLKQEMLALDSLIVQAAFSAQVPAGNALAVDRQIFSENIEKKLLASKKFQRINSEIKSLEDVEKHSGKDDLMLIATGPLTGSALAADMLEKLTDSETASQLYFYDAIAPIIDADSIDFSAGFFAGRYGQEADYFNIPLDKELYETFCDAVQTSEKMPLHEFEEAKYFESCLPIEVMLERGRETLRFGPMKPVGLPDPTTGKIPHACIQLRKENTAGTMYSLVGFQTKMKWPEQKRVFSLLPALREAQFHRYGSVHRNTYFESPKLLTANLSFKKKPHIFLAGQVTGVEGYTESAAMGLLAGLSIAAQLQKRFFVPPPKHTMLGALYCYVTRGANGPYQPMNVHFGLLEPIAKKRGVSKEMRRLEQCQRAREAFLNWQGSKEVQQMPAL